MVARTLTAAQIAALRLPTRDEVHNVVAAIPQLQPGTWRRWQTAPATFLEVGPGLLRIFRTSAHLKDAAGDRGLQNSARDLARKLRRERAVYRQPMALTTDSDLALLDGRDAPRMRTSRGKITAWSDRSRSRMKQQLRRIDYAPLFEAGLEPAMVTLTMPGLDDEGRDTWADYAPSPEAFKRIVDRFLSAYRAAWGARLAGVWKLEFQRRGAPHLHILMTPPAGIAGGDHPLEFAAWLAEAWPRSVGATGNVLLRHKKVTAHASTIEYVGEQYRDPRRIAVYFGKHGFFAAKEYQNALPKVWLEAMESGARGARYWGVWSLPKASAVLQLDDAGMASVEVLIDPLGVTRVWANIIAHYRRNDDGTWSLVEERRPSATDASWARAYQRMADDAGTRSSDAVIVQRYMRKLARAQAMRGQQLVRNAHGQLVLPRESPVIRRIKFEQPDDRGTYRTVRRYRIGFYVGGSGHLAVNDGRVCGRDIQRLLDRQSNWAAAA